MSRNLEPQIRLRNPQQDYRILKKRSNQSYTAIRKADNLLFTIKWMKQISLVSNYVEIERRLLKYCRVNSDRLVNVIEVYKHKETYFFVVEFTNAYSTVSNLMKSYRKKQRGEYSEEFCKYTIYSVLQGIQALQLEPGLVTHANLSVKNVLLNLQTAKIKLISEPDVDAKQVKKEIKDIWSQL